MYLYDLKCDQQSQQVIFLLNTARLLPYCSHCAGSAPGQAQDSAQLCNQLAVS